MVVSLLSGGLLCIQGGGFTHDDTDPKNHVRNIAGLLRPKRVDKLSQRTTKGVRQTHNRRGRHPSMVRKPHITIPRWRSQHKRLRQSRQDLAKVYGTQIACLCSRISDPVSDQEQDRGDYDGLLGAGMEDAKGEGRAEEEGEEEACRYPIYGCDGAVKVFC